METLCKIRNIYRAIVEYEGCFQKMHNLCLNEGMLLCGLSKGEKLTSGEIARSMGLTNSNTSKVIKSVEEKKLIKRTLGKSDKRQIYFSLTKEGWNKLEEISCNKVEVPALLKDSLICPDHDYFTKIKK